MLGRVINGYLLSASESAAISYLRVLALLLILLCHICLSYHTGWEYLLNIGVQIFFLISGILHGLKGIDNARTWYRSKFIKIFVPYYIYLLCALPIFAFFSTEGVSIRQVVVYLVDIQWFVGGGIKGLGQLWFMSAIAVCYLVTPLLQKFRQYSTHVSIVLIAIALVNYSMLHKMETYFSALFLYTIGYYLINANTNVRKFIGWGSFVVSLSIFLLPSVEFSMLIQKGANSFNRLFHDFMSIGIVVVSLQFFNTFNLSKVSKVVKWFGAYSFSIYLVHGMYCTGSPFSVFVVEDNVFLAIIWFLVATFFSACVLDILSNKIRKKLDSFHQLWKNEI